ncbi:MAG: hypothetical protein GEV28_13240 [Actinophytocola sp.]|nr:hypothetical protein [Actinophytocola sp.]
MLPDEYFDDFRREFWTDNRGVSWKFERRQEFVEPEDESWAASRRGQWHESLRILESRRKSIADYERRMARNGIEVRRVRVVEKPVSAYLLWELSSLDIRHRCGGKIRVVDGSHVAPFERDGPLPELFLIGDKVVYQVVYDESGTLQGAVKSTEVDAVRHWTAFVRHLYDLGEELDSYFEREVAGLIPHC